MSTEIELLSVQLFNSKYGTELNSRFAKLKEETNELFEAYESFMLGNENSSLHLLDEISDVQAVLTHIEHLFNVDSNKCLLNVILKTKIREYIPTYKKF